MTSETLYSLPPHDLPLSSPYSSLSLKGKSFPFRAPHCYYPAPSCAVFSNRDYLSLQITPCLCLSALVDYYFASWRAIQQ